MVEEIKLTGALTKITHEIRSAKVNPKDTPQRQRKFVVSVHMEALLLSTTLLVFLPLKNQKNQVDSEPVYLMRAHPRHATNTTDPHKASWNTNHFQDTQPEP